MLVIGALFITLTTFLHGARRWRRESATRILLAPGAYTQPHPRPTSISMPLLANGINANHSVWLEAGGRHIDTAFIYGDDQQKSIGEAIRRSQVPRGDLFVTTKVACCPTLRCNKFCVDSNDVSAYDPAAQLNHSIQLLGLGCPPSRFAHRKSHGYARSTSCGFVDLALLHFPCSRFEDTLKAYKVLVDARDRGLARAVGVSNFNASLLQALLDAVEAPSLGKAGARPAVVQNSFSIAGHPAAHDGVGNACLEGSRLYGSTDETLELARHNGIVFQAYSPLGGVSNVDVLGRREVRRIAEKYGRTPAQVAMRWLVQRRVGAVSATANPQHASELLDVSRFRLADADMAVLSGLT